MFNLIRNVASYATQENYQVVVDAYSRVAQAVTSSPFKVLILLYFIFCVYLYDRIPIRRRFSSNFIFFFFQYWAMLLQYFRYIFVFCLKMRIFPVD